MAYVYFSKGQERSKRKARKVWTGMEKKGECLRELKKEALLFAMQTTGPDLVGLVLPVPIL